MAGIGGVLCCAAAVRGPGTVHFICLGGGVCPVPALWPPEGLCLVPAVSPGFRWRSDGEEYPYYLPAHRDAQYIKSDFLWIFAIVLVVYIIINIIAKKNKA